LGLLFLTALGLTSSSRLFAQDEPPPPPEEFEAPEPPMEEPPPMVEEPPPPPEPYNDPAPSTGPSSSGTTAAPGTASIKIQPGKGAEVESVRIMAGSHTAMVRSSLWWPHVKPDKEMILAVISALF
jgi:hypothetical protein